MKLETQLFCLYFSPLLAVTLMNLGFYVILFEQVKSIIEVQEEKIYFDQQTSKKQIIMGLKAHLDQSLSLQSQEYYTLSNFIAKTFESNITLNPGFVKPILNLERLYNDLEDPVLVSIYKRDPILASIWANDPVQQVDLLPAKSQDEFNKGAIFDILIRSFNLLNVQRTFRYNNQFFGFSSSGMLIANPAYNNSMNESFQSESLCPGKLYYDATCRPWFQKAIKSTGSLMIAPHKVLTTKVPYMALSLCRRSDANDITVTVACQALKIEQVASVFSTLEIQTGSFRVIHPSSGDLIYEKSITDYQQHYSWLKEMTANMTSTESDFFRDRMNNILTQFSNQEQYGVNVASYVKSLNVTNVQGFEFEQQGEKEYCLIIPIQVADKRIGSKDNETQFSDVMILIYVFRRGEMVQAFSDVQAYLSNIFMANSIFYLIMLVVCLVIIIYYTKKFTKLIESPIATLIDKINSVSALFLKKHPKHLESQQDIVVIFDNKSGRNSKFHHTCLELSLLEKYITSIQEVFNYNLNYKSPIHDTNALFVCVKSIQHFESTDDAKALGSALNNLANIHFNNSRYLSSLECFCHSLVCLQKERSEAIAYWMAKNDQINSYNNTDQDFNSRMMRLINSTQEKLSKSFLFPWIERYFPGKLTSHISNNRSNNSNNNNTQYHGSQNAKNITTQTSTRSRSSTRHQQSLEAILNSFESLRFDRQFAYSQVLLACYLDHQMDSNGSERSSNSTSYDSNNFPRKNDLYLHILEQQAYQNPSPSSQNQHNNSSAPPSPFLNSKQKSYSTTKTRVKKKTKAQSAAESSGASSDYAILSEYEEMLKKLLKSISALNHNDPNRSILVYLEISKLLLLKHEHALARDYFSLAMRCFLDLFKRVRRTAFYNSSYASNPYLAALTTQLLRRFSAEELNDQELVVQKRRKTSIPRKPRMSFQQHNQQQQQQQSNSHRHLRSMSMGSSKLLLLPSTQLNMMNPFNNIPQTTSNIIFNTSSNINNNNNNAFPSAQVVLSESSPLSTAGHLITASLGQTLVAAPTTKGIIPILEEEHDSQEDTQLKRIQLKSSHHKKSCTKREKKIQVNQRKFPATEESPQPDHLSITRFPPAATAGSQTPQTPLGPHPIQHQSQQQQQQQQLTQGSPLLLTTAPSHIHHSSSPFLLQQQQQQQHPIQPNNQSCFALYTQAFTLGSDKFVNTHDSFHAYVTAEEPHPTNCEGSFQSSSFEHEESLIVNCSIESIVSQLDELHAQTAAASKYPWTEQTCYAYPLDILFTKLQVHEAILETTIAIVAANNNNTNNAKKVQNISPLQTYQPIGSALVTPIATSTTLDQIQKPIQNSALQYEHYKIPQPSQQIDSQILTPSSVTSLKVIEQPQLSQNQQQQLQQEQQYIQASQHQDALTNCALRLSEAFEFAPRYLPSDRLQLLHLLEHTFRLTEIDPLLIQKQQAKFQQIKVKVSIIVNCEDSQQLKRISKYLYEIYELSHTFSLLVVNEQVEQYILPINQQSFRGKEIFMNNVMKYLRFKKIRSRPSFFLSALSKASFQFFEEYNLPIHSNRDKLVKKYVLIFGNKESIFKESKQFFAHLRAINVKILLFNPEIASAKKKKQQQQSNWKKKQQYPHSTRTLTPPTQQNLPSDQQAKQFQSMLGEENMYSDFHDSIVSDIDESEEQGEDCYDQNEIGNVKIRMFSEFIDLINYLKRKAINCNTAQPFLVEKI